MYYVPSQIFLPGTWIQVATQLLVKHHGIVGWSQTLGTQTVIHSLKGIGVVETPMSGFSGNFQPEIVRYPFSPHEAELILRRAYSQIGKRYNLLQANCEHFASWAFTGVPHSNQVAFAVISSLAVGLAFTATRGDR